MQTNHNRIGLMGLPVGRNYQILVVSLNVVCLFILIWLRFASNGWSTITLSLPNSVALAIKLWIIVLIVRDGCTAAQGWGEVFGALALLLAIGLQRDYGDGAEKWFVFQRLFLLENDTAGNNIPSWWPLNGGDSQDLLLFIPWSLTVMAFFGLRTKEVGARAN